MEQFKNKLIIFEGIDLTGKTTAAKLLTNKLNNEGIKTIFTFQPGDDRYGVHAQIIRSFCKDKRYRLHPLSGLFAFLLDRSEQTNKVVIPALKEGYTVISDRWWHSTITYQFYGKQLLEKYNLSKEFVYWMNHIASHGTSPDVIFYFKNRIRKPERIIKENDYFDSAAEEFKNRVEKGYDEVMSNEHNVIEVPLCSSPTNTLNTILDLYKYKSP